jgi:cell wall-associated NlpC family hydrolase
MRSIRLIATVSLCLLALASAFPQRGSARTPTRAAVGKLGQLTQKAPIYTKPNKGARILYRGEANLYVVLRDLNSEWATLVMADGSNGFVEAKYVEALPYEVDVRKDAAPPAPLATRGGFERSALTGDTGNQIVQVASRYLGTPYKWGGNDLVAGIDCSGFVSQVFRQFGVKLPRTAQEQSYIGMAVDRVDQLQAGDRLYFTDGDRMRITHTGIYMGNGYFIHSSSGNNGVSTNFLSEKWLRMLVNARR